MIQYLGFESKSSVRVYRFRVTHLNVERLFSLSIDNQSLVDSQFKFQDAPDLCYSKLKNALSSEESDHDVPLKMNISEVELQQYIQEHYPSKRNKQSLHK